MWEPQEWQQQLSPGWHELQHLYPQSNYIGRERTVATTAGTASAATNGKECGDQLLPDQPGHPTWSMRLCV